MHFKYWKLYLCYTLYSPTHSNEIPEIIPICISRADSEPSLREKIFSAFLSFSCFTKRHLLKFYWKIYWKKIICPTCSELARSDGISFIQSKYWKTTQFDVRIFKCDFLQMRFYWLARVSVRSWKQGRFVCCYFSSLIIFYYNHEW